MRNVAVPLFPMVLSDGKGAAAAVHKDCIHGTSCTAPILSRKARPGLHDPHAGQDSTERLYKRNGNLAVKSRKQQETAHR